MVGGLVRQQVRSTVLGADRVGLGLFIVLSLLVAIYRHGKAETYDESVERQRGDQDRVEILADLGGHAASSSKERCADLRRKPECQAGYPEQHQRIVQ